MMIPTQAEHISIAMDPPSGHDVSGPTAGDAVIAQGHLSSTPPARSDGSAVLVPDTGWICHSGTHGGSAVPLAPTVSMSVDVFVVFGGDERPDVRSIAVVGPQAIMAANRPGYEVVEPARWTHRHTVARASPTPWNPTESPRPSCPSSLSRCAVREATTAFGAALRTVSSPPAST